MVVFSITMFVICCCIVLWILLKQPDEGSSRPSTWSDTKPPSIESTNDPSWQKPDPAWLKPIDPPAEASTQFKISSGWLNAGGKSTWLTRLLSAGLRTTNVPTKIVFNGQEFSSPDQMPSDVRRVYDQTISGVLADANENGVPDVFEGEGSKGVFHVEMKSTPEDAAAKLKALREMKDSGLISDAEYEAKKAEILSRM
ncbi:MAG: SHOCT domain-containing protein [Pyrinomonadaceae bacterium]